MADPQVTPELTTYDKVSVSLYRGGIIISTLCLIYFVFASYIWLSSPQTDMTFYPSYLEYIPFWLFVVSVATSITFLHLYSSQILKVVQSFSVISILILVYLGISNGSEELLFSLIKSEGGTGKLATIGFGFSLAAFGAIGAKEAFCFKLYEGYLYAILSAILVLMHLSGIIPPIIEVIWFAIITLLVIIFTIRKMRLPLHYDIGDKTRYQ